MIKRRFYRLEHGEQDGASSDSSSSSSDDEPQVSDNDAADPQVSDNDDVGNDDVTDHDDDEQPGHLPSGYESEDSSANEIEADTTGLISKEEVSESESDKELLNANPFSKKEIDGTLETLSKDLPDNVASCVLKCKSVYKCRLCPKIVCLNAESLTTHVKSKRHARSEKLLSNGRLKRILNSDGEEEIISDEDGETHAERHARIKAWSQEIANKKGKGRQRQRKRLKKKKDSSDIPSSGPQKENRAKRRRKNVD